MLQSSWTLMIDRLKTMLDGAGQAVIDILDRLALVMVGWLIASLLARLVLALLRGLRFNDGMRSMLGEGAPMRHEPALVAARVIQGTV
jgi:hypothetical protein